MNEDNSAFEHHHNQFTELRPDEVARCHPRHFKIYTAVDPADGIHRDMPPEHPSLLSEEDFRKLIAGINLETAAVQWACRNLPLPGNARSDLDCWVFFVEAAPGMWVRFEDLPEELAKALLEKNLYELIMRPIQRPFSAEQLTELIKEITQIDPATAVCDWTYADFCDPYGLGDVPHVQVGREEFVKASGDRWVWFGDLPAETLTALRQKHEDKLAFPAGLDTLFQERQEEPEQASGKLGGRSDEPSAEG
jgi:hypothetical protein